MIKSMLLKNPKERKMPHSTFYYPIDGGIQSMVNAIAQGLTIKYDAPISSIEKTDKGWRINGEGEFDSNINNTSA